MPVFVYEVADQRGSVSRGPAEAAEQQVLSLIEPIMIVITGAIAGSVIFALSLPILNAGQAMKGGLR